MTTSISDPVALYTSAGFTLFPCKNDKTPKYVGWQQTKFNAKLSAEDLPKVFGVLLEDGDLVLDVDPRRFNGTNQIKALFESLGISLPLNTFIVESGRGDGGKHIYMKMPAGTKVKARVPGFDAIECKALGKFVVAAGSVHPMTKAPYTVYRGTPKEIMQAPDALIELIRQEEIVYVDSIEDDGEDNQGMFIRHLMRVDPAIQGNAGNTTTYIAACKGKEFGLSEEKCYEIMLLYWNPRCQPEWSEQELRNIVAHAYSYAQNIQGSRHFAADYEGLDIEAATPKYEHKIWWDCSYSGNVKTIKPTLSNTVNYFYLPHLPGEEKENPLLDLFAYNLLTNRIEFTKRAPWHKEDGIKDWDDEQGIQLKYFLSHNCNYSAITTTLCHEAALIVSMNNRYHPIRDWLSAIRWDGKPRLDMLLPTYAGTVNTKYTREVGKNTIIALVARAFVPGCQHDSMLVLDGEQGIFKSTFVAVLGGEWGADIKLSVEGESDTKRTITKMIGKWVIETSEMVFTKKSTVDAVKSFITCRVDTVLLPYARCAKDILRSSGFIGTINPEGAGEYLTDSTGNRRFWSVVCGKIDIEKLKADREQIFAEAVYRYKKGEAWHITDPEILEMAKQEQMARTFTDSWEDCIADYLHRNKEVVPKYISTQYVATVIFGIPEAKTGKLETNRIARAMRALGYVQVDRYMQEFGRNKKVWIPKEHDV